MAKINKKKALGKGLDIMIGEEIEDKIKSENRNLVDIEIDSIKTNALQPRKTFDDELILTLADSIKRNGILQPLILREIIDGYEIIAGERRFRAAKIANLNVVPAIIMNPSEQKLYEIALIENMQRVDLNPIEEALAFKSLINDFNITQKEVGKIVGKSRVYITNSLRLLQLEDFIQNAIINGDLSSGHAKVLVGLMPEIQKEMLDLINKEKISVRALEKKIKKIKTFSSDSDVSNIKNKDSNYIYYQTYIEELEDLLGTKVDIQLNKNKNKLVIDFYDDMDFERIIDLIKK